MIRQLQYSIDPKFDCLLFLNLPNHEKFVKLGHIESHHSDDLSQFKLHLAINLHHYLVYFVLPTFKLVHPLALVQYRSAHYWYPVSHDVHVVRVILYLLQVTLWIIAIFPQVNLLCLIERPLCSKGYVKVHISCVLNH